MPETVQLPPKRPGEHRWIAAAMFTLTDGQASASLSPKTTVSLSQGNLVSIQVGCVDCEGEYREVRGKACVAEAAPEFSDDTARPATDPSDPALLAGVDLIGRTGARNFEVGFAEHGHGDWYATATYQGRKAFTEDHVGPVEATLALASQLIEGGECTHCHRTTAIGPVDEPSPDVCYYTRQGDKYERGCA